MMIMLLLLLLMMMMTNTTAHLPKIGLFVLKELSQLVTGADQEVGVNVHVDDEVDGLEEDSVLGVGVLHLLGLGGLLSFVQNGLQTLCQPRPHAGVLWCYSQQDRSLF